MKQKGLAMLLPMAGLSGLFAGLVVGLLVTKTNLVTVEGNDDVATSADQNDDVLKRTRVGNDVVEADPKETLTRSLGDSENDKTSVAKANDTEKTKSEWALRFDVHPKQARSLSTIRVNGILLDEFDVSLPKHGTDKVQANVNVEAVGFKPYQQSLSVDGNQTIVVNLVPVKKDTAKNVNTGRDQKQKDAKDNRGDFKSQTKTGDGSSKSTKPKTGASKSKNSKGPGGLIDL